MFCPFDSAKIILLLLRLLFFIRYFVCCALGSSGYLVVAVFGGGGGDDDDSFLFSYGSSCLKSVPPLSPLRPYYFNYIEYYFQFPFQWTRYSLECLGNVPHLCVY